MEINTLEKRIERLSSHITEFTGTSLVFILALACVLIWAISGPFLHFSENWQLLINTITSIVTFLMVFLIQRAQNKDYKAIQIKLNELIASNEKASNRIVSVEELTESEINVLQKFYSNLSADANKDGDITTIYTTPGESIEIVTKETTTEKK
jgi:low affinity Fe/Cu permease